MKLLGMNLNYEGFEKELIFEINKLFNELNDNYEKVVGRKFDVNDNKFIKEIFGKEFDLYFSDKEGMLSMALFILHTADKETNVVSLFQNYRFAMALNIHTENEINKELLNKRLKAEAANVRWKLDPKNKEKAFIKECWMNWRDCPSNYESKAQFARDMLDKSAHLTSTKVIEDWCREWEKS